MSCPQARPRLEDHVFATPFAWPRVTTITMPIPTTKFQLPDMASVTLAECYPSLRMGITTRHPCPAFRTSLNASSQDIVLHLHQQGPKASPQDTPIHPSTPTQVTTRVTNVTGRKMPRSRRPSLASKARGRRLLGAYTVASGVTQAATFHLPYRSEDSPAQATTTRIRGPRMST